MRHGATVGVGLGLVLTVASWLVFPGVAASPSPQPAPAIERNGSRPGAVTADVPSSPVLVVVTPSTTRAPDLAGSFVDALNEVRADAGVGAVAADPHLAALAQSWAQRLAAEGRLSHSELIYEVIEDPEWIAAGENVGYGPTVADLLTAFVASPSHAANIVDPDYRAVGVGAVEIDGVIWTAHLFAG